MLFGYKTADWVSVSMTVISLISFHGEQHCGVRELSDARRMIRNKVITRK